MVDIVEFLVLLFYVAIKFVLPGAFIGWALIRGGRWVYERYQWLRWFSL